MPYGLLSQFAIMILVGGALLYWSRELALRTGAWDLNMYKKFPALKRLFRADKASTESCYKRTLICYRICGALLVAGGVSFSADVFFVLFVVRFHIAGGFPLAGGVTVVIFLILFLVLMIVSRDHRLSATMTKVNGSL
ncbi:MAG: hypothetical protein WBQ34_11685 [Candidatus Acidiferrales bacterium]